MKFSEHKENWINCDICELCETRKNVVLLRGKIPCDVLFIGEAPGRSEDVLGKPFVGPAGQELDKMIEVAVKNSLSNLKFAFTNLISCIPLDEAGGKVSAPEPQWVDACSARLTECIDLCKPKKIIYVGNEAWEYMRKIERKIEHPPKFRSIKITHPAAILRAKSPQKEFAISKNINKLSNHFAEVFTEKL